MQREVLQSISSHPKRIHKSTDLKRRLFEVGINPNIPSVARPPILNPLASPKNKLNAKNNSSHQEKAQLLKYKPSQSPKLVKTTSKDFFIRKSPKQLFSPKAQQNQTLSHFGRSEKIENRQNYQHNQSEITQKLERRRLQQHDICIEQPTAESKLDEYVSLVLRGTDHIDQFLYLIRGKQDNIYELQLVNFETVRQHEGQIGYEYYTVSKKGFCQYVSGKPQNFLEIGEWAHEKAVYMKIKSLKFFNRFRRWKTIQMWRSTITKQRRQAISQSLKQRLFLLDPINRGTILELRKLSLNMEKAVLIIAKNEGTYTLQSFKHCQQRARRQASLAVEQFSRQSRNVVRRCFDNKLSQLRQQMKKGIGDDQIPQSPGVGGQSAKEGAFQVLGFPSKMSYQHRSKLRKQAGRFIRFSYLVDSLHLSCLAGLYSSQVSNFIQRLQTLQLQGQIYMKHNLDQNKDEFQSQKMFMMQLESNFSVVPQNITCRASDSSKWSPYQNILVKGQSQKVGRQVPGICEHWLSFQPSVDDILDELIFFLRQGLGSIKCFERWARHREMQKFVSILEEWDDLVSENWQISQNDNLDPLLLLDSLDSSLSTIKNILKQSEERLSQKMQGMFTNFLNAYWQYSQTELQKLESRELLNPSQTIQKFLTFTTNLLSQINIQLPHRVQLGILYIQVTRLKNTMIGKFQGIINNLKNRLPVLIQGRCQELNAWLSLYGGKLKQQILNIDDYVRTVRVIAEVQKQFGERRDQCIELGQIYQIMQDFKMDVKKRKQFETVTLKLKDQMDHLLANAEHHIERKMQLYTKEVQKYHRPQLLKGISKVADAVNSAKYLSLSSNRRQILQDLSQLKKKQVELKEENQKCLDYMSALKINGQGVEELSVLSTQIQARIILWRSLEQWEQIVKQISHRMVGQIPLLQLQAQISKYEVILNDLQEKLSSNQVLTHLKTLVNDYALHLPLLKGIGQSLSDRHWSQIYELLPQGYKLDLKKKQFNLESFVKSGLSPVVKEVQLIFEKSRVENKLQQEYQSLEESWMNLMIKSKTPGKFSLIVNGPALRDQLDSILMLLSTLLSNPHAQSLKQYSITYDFLIITQKCLDRWLVVQQRISEYEKYCRVLDLKKLPDFSHFQSAERIYKMISKGMSKGIQVGPRLGKLILPGVDQKLAEIQFNLNKIQINITNILTQHRKSFPPLYLFSDQQLLKLMTQPSIQYIEKAACFLTPAIASLETQNDRITCIITEDEDRLIKNPIMTNCDFQQILFQISETVAELSRRLMRGCRYKAVQTNLITLVGQYNIQQLLAVSRVDFSHYTTIAIDNQEETPDSLEQFRKIMRKDTAEDIRIRGIKMKKEQLTPSLLRKYDSLLLQQLHYEEILDHLIKSRISKPDEFSWASQLKFDWEDSSSDEANITAKQLYAAARYGNDWIGSRTKVILYNQAEVLLGIKSGQSLLYNGCSRSLQRLLNAIGYKALNYLCLPHTSQVQLKHYLIGCYYADYIPLVALADKLSNQIINDLTCQKWIDQFSSDSLRKNSSFVKETDRARCIFMTVSDSSQAYSFEGKMRVVNYIPPNSEILKSSMKMLNIYDSNKTTLLSRIFESVTFLQKKSFMQGVSIPQFLDQITFDSQPINEHQLFARALDYLKPKISSTTLQALTSHLQSLAVLPLQQNTKKNSDRMQQIVDALWQRKVLIVTGKGGSKKHFLQRQLGKRQNKLVTIYAQTFSSKQILSFKHNIISSSEDEETMSILEKYMSESQPTVYYIQGVTSHFILALQNMLYNNKLLRNKLFSSKVCFLIDIARLDQLGDPKVIASFTAINYEATRQYILNRLNEWPQENLPQDKRRLTNKILVQIILPTLDSLTQKNQQILQEKVISYLNLLNCLMPCTKPLQAALYCLLMLYRNAEEQQLKLQFLIKKHLSDQKVPQCTKITQLVYAHCKYKQGLMSESQFLKKWINENPENIFNRQFVVTPQIAHFVTLIRRIHQKTLNTAVIQGRSCSGKSTLLKTYRYFYHSNSYYTHVSVQQGESWTKKLMLPLQKHSRDTLGSKINYQWGVVMIDDVHLAQQNSLVTLNSMLNYQQHSWGDRIMKLKNIKFIMSCQKTPQILKDSCIKLFLDMNFDQRNKIFEEYMSQNIDPNWQISALLQSKIVKQSFETIRRIFLEDQNQSRLSFAAVRRIIKGFGRLKIRQGVPAIKQIQKYWAFSLQQVINHNKSSDQIARELMRLDLHQHGTNLLSFSHLCHKGTEKKLQNLKDSKKIYSTLNEKIQKYNEGDTKRYGQTFDFINFDNILEKIVSISHSILLDTDHMLVGRRGTGKQSLAKLAAFFNGFHYKSITGDINKSIIEIINSSTPMPYLLFKRIASSENKQELKRYYYSDLQSEILAHMQDRSKGPAKEKQKITFTITKFVSKNDKTSQNYVNPKPKISREEINNFRKSIRIILSCQQLSQIKDIPVAIRVNFHVDVIEEVPSPSLVQYNQKLLTMDGITCNKAAELLMSQIYQYSRDRLKLPIRANDDCVRLFSSFIANLIPQLAMQSQRFSKILDLLDRLRNCCKIIIQNIQDCHAKLKMLTQSQQGGQGNRELKMGIQNDLRQKSNSLSVGEKLVEALAWLQDQYKEKYFNIKNLLTDQGQLEIVFAITASYFIFVSHLNYPERRAVLHDWFTNVKSLKQMPIITSFLQLFVLYEQQFNTEPVDNLPEFYENMAIIFHSAKPIAIRDHCCRGRQWLQKNSAFLYIRQDHKEFIQTIRQFLSKPNNVLIQVVDQQTLNNLQQTPIGNLIFLPQDTNTVTLRGEEVQVHQEAKLYLLVGKDLQLPPHVAQEFTVVVYGQSEQMMKTALSHEYLSSLQRENQVVLLDWNRKMRNIRLDCNNTMSQLGENIHEQICGEEDLPSEEEMIKKLGKLTDKLLVRAQNQFSKTRQKEDAIVQCRQKYQRILEKIDYIQVDQFYRTFKQVRKVFAIMNNQNIKKSRYSQPSFSEFLSVIKAGLTNNIFNNIPSFLLFALRHWGAIYDVQEYLIFACLLITILRKQNLQTFVDSLTQKSIRNGNILLILTGKAVPLANQDQLQSAIIGAFIQEFTKVNMKSIQTFAKIKSSPYVPVVWPVEEGPQQLHRIVHVVSQLAVIQVKSRIQMYHPKLQQPSQQQSLETILKKHSGQELQLFVSNPSKLTEVQKTLKSWGFTAKTILFVVDNQVMKHSRTITSLDWYVRLENEQFILNKIINNQILSSVKNQILKDQSNTLETKQSEEDLCNKNLTTSQTQQLISKEIKKENYSGLVQEFVQVIQQKYQNLGFKLFAFSQNQLNLARKRIQSFDASIPLKLKIERLLINISKCIKPPINQINTFIEETIQKIVKLAQSLNQEQFLSNIRGYLSVESSPKQNCSQKQFLKMQLGWLIRTRKTLGLEVSSIYAKYVEIIKQYSQSCKEHTRVTISRATKKVNNIRLMKKESLVRGKSMGRESLKKRASGIKISSQKVQNSELTRLFLAKQAENYEQILQNILNDLIKTQSELQKAEFQQPSSQAITVIEYLMKNMPTPEWRFCFATGQITNMSSEKSIEAVINRRNQLFTLQTKLSVSENCEVNFKNFRYPGQFLRAFFRSQLTSYDIFYISNALTPQEAQRGQYLKIQNIWAMGWRISPDGFFQLVAESKPVQMHSCYIVKKSTPSIGFMNLDLFIDPSSQSDVPLMRLYAYSKRSQATNISYKLYLKNQ